MEEHETRQMINVASIYGARTRQPLVTIQIGDTKPLTIPPESAREVAESLLQCAEAAEQDAVLMSFAQDDLGLSIDNAAQVLMRLRAWRAAREDRVRRAR